LDPKLISTIGPVPEERKEHAFKSGSVKTTIGSIDDDEGTELYLATHEEEEDIDETPEVSPTNHNEEQGTEC